MKLADAQPVRKTDIDHDQFAGHQNVKAESHWMCRSMRDSQLSPIQSHRPSHVFPADGQARKASFYRQRSVRQ